MEELVNKLTEEQKMELSNLCQKINDIFENSNLTETDMDEYSVSSLNKGIEQVMFLLGLWCQEVRL